MTTVNCTCGTTLRLKSHRGRCPKCERIVSAPDDDFRILEVHAPEKSNEPEWEVYVVLLLLGIELLLQGLSLLNGVIGVPAVSAVILIVLMIGVYQRAGWAWWLTLGCAAVEALLCALVLSQTDRLKGVDLSIVYVHALLDALILILLFVVRKRGGYVPAET